MPNFIETVRRIEGKGPLDVSLFAGFILFGALTGSALWIVGAGLGFMRFLVHRALNPQERQVSINSHAPHQNEHAQVQHAAEHTAQPTASAHGTQLPSAA